MSGIFGILNDTNVTPHILQGLKVLEAEYGKYDWVGIATLSNGRIQQRQMPGKLENLQQLLQKQKIRGHFGLALARHLSQRKGPHNPAQLCGSERVAIAHSGVIENLSEFREELSSLGYEFSSHTAGEVLLKLFNHYLDKDISPTEAAMLLMMRLYGYFAIVAIIAHPEGDLLIAVRRGSVLGIGANENVVFVSSNLEALSKMCRYVMYLEEGMPAILRSANMAFEEPRLERPDYPPYGEFSMKYYKG